MPKQLRGKLGGPSGQPAGTWRTLHTLLSQTKTHHMLLKNKSRQQTCKQHPLMTSTVILCVLGSLHANPPKSKSAQAKSRIRRGRARLGQRQSEWPGCKDSQPGLCVKDDLPVTSEAGPRHTFASDCARIHWSGRKARRHMARGLAQCTRERNKGLAFNLENDCASDWHKDVGPPLGSVCCTKKQN